MQCCKRKVIMDKNTSPDRLVKVHCPVPIIYAPISLFPVTNEWGSCLFCLASKIITGSPFKI